VTNTEISLVWLLFSCLTCLLLLVRYRIGVTMLLILLVVPAPLLPTRILGITGLNAFNPPFLVMVACLLLHRLPSAHYDRRLTAAFWLVMALYAVAVLRSALDFETLVQSGSAALSGGASLPAYLRDYFLKPVQYVVTLVIAARCFQTERAQRAVLFWILVAYAAGCLAAMVRADILWQFLEGVVPNIKSTGGLIHTFGAHPNDVQVKMCVLICLAILLLQQGLRASLRFVVVLSMAVLGLSLLACASRATLVSFAAGSAMFIFLQPSRFRRVALIGVCTALLALGIALVPAYRQKALNVLSVGPWSALYAEREDIWDPLHGDLKSHFVFGNGRHAMMRSPRYDWIKYHEGGSQVQPGEGIDHPHNAYLEIALDTGAVGLASVLGLLLIAARQALQRWKQGGCGSGSVASGAALCGLPIFCASALSGQTFYPTAPNMTLWLVIFLGTGKLAGIRASVRTPSPRRASAPLNRR
jgi:O-antigen ligase